MRLSVFEPVLIKQLAFLCYIIISLWTIYRYLEKAFLFFTIKLQGNIGMYAIFMALSSIVTLELRII